MGMTYTHRLTRPASGINRCGEVRYPRGTPVMVEAFSRSQVMLTFPRGESLAVWDAATAARELRPTRKWKKECPSC
jgi:hypothetical protein